MDKSINHILGLDVGEKRIGLACASWPKGIPQPLTTISNDEKLFNNLSKILSDMAIVLMVIGLPRSLSMEETQQTQYVKQFIELLKQKFDLPIYTTDEALTSIKAEDELVNKRVKFTRADIDALSATYILEDFISNNQGPNLV